MTSPPPASSPVRPSDRKSRALLVVAILAGALIVLGSLATAAVVTLRALGQDPPAQPPVTSTVTGTCPSGQVRVDISIVDESEITLNVLNGSTRANLAAQTGAELANRGFRIGRTGSEPAGYAGVAKIVYGPQAVGRGWLVQAYFLAGEAEVVFEPAREGVEVDLVLGEAFQALNTATEVNQRIAALGRPRAPAGTCSA